MKLTYAQTQLLAKAPAEWGALPAGVGCTNSTLEALERRGLVETRIRPGHELKFFSGWDWRRKPLAEFDALTFDTARDKAAKALYDETMTTP